MAYIYVLVCILARLQFLEKNVRKTVHYNAVRN